MRRSSGRVVAGAVLVVVGAAWLLESAGVVDLSTRALLAIGLTVIGVALVVMSRRGAPTGLLIGGIVISAILLVDSPDGFVNVRGDRGAGLRERVFRPKRADDLRPYKVDAGQLVIDLTDIELDGDGTHDVTGNVSAGQILVVVPKGVPIRVDASTGTGGIYVLGDRRAAGLSVEDVFESDDYDTERPRVSMELRASAGTIRVVEDGAQARERLREMRTKRR